MPSQLVSPDPLLRLWLPALLTEVEADDVLLDLVEGLEPARPVVVVSNDRRVRSGARRRGANVLASDQLVVLLGQRPG